MSEGRKVETVNVVNLQDARATEHDLVGGKGANLGHLTGAGFRVPSGFVVTTNAYAAYLTDPATGAEIRRLLAEIDYDDIELLEEKTERIRETVARSPMPQSVSDDILAAYTAVGSNRYVAVRSSGTAEDLEGTSFAGLHDTYLDVIGPEHLLDAVRLCWASLWSARATVYRQRHGFDHFEAELAVVVQEMVASEVSGVMFTGNPRTAATDETVINASWGLGEAVVQGIVTPDEYTVKSGMLLIDGKPRPGSQHVLERSIGAKEKEYVRNPETGQGTIVVDTAAARRSETAMTDAQIVELAGVGERITSHYQGYPQDVEWALAEDTLYILQSRPITGVEFSWDADVNLSHQVTSFRYPPEDPIAVRTRAMADEAWTGAVTPLTYSWLANQWNQVWWEAAIRIGRRDLLERTPFNYYKGCAYWDCKLDSGIFSESALPMSRQWSVDRLPEEFREAALSANFGVFDWLKQLARSKTIRPDLGPYGWFKVMQDYIDNRRDESDGLPDSALPSLTDEELIAYSEQQAMVSERFNRSMCVPGFFFLCRDSMAALGKIVEEWYDGDNEHVFTHLVTGTPKRTWTVREHVDLFGLASLIRRNDELVAAFDRYRDGEFFDHVKTVESATDFRAGLEEFLATSGHRGHADRDLYFPRYCEEPWVLYSALSSHLKSEDDPVEQERKNNDLREAAYQEVLSNIKRGPLGFAKAEAFKIVHDYVMRFFTLRDDERWYGDRITFSIKKAALEMNRRMMERGIFETERDFYFLTFPELNSLFRTGAETKLTRWKIEGRMRNFDKYDQKLVSMPKYLLRNQPYQTQVRTAAFDEQGRPLLHGFGTSGGEVTAIARVVRSLKEVSRVNKGEIMITNSTDPGWTPIFAALSGVIVETGGLLSHSGCLAREYGFPAAHIEDAVSRIPDGATITLNGNTGWVRIDSVPADEPVLVEAAGS